MFDQTFIVISLVGLCFYNSALCELDKSNEPPRQLSLRNELAKKGFNHVYLYNESIPTITQELLQEVAHVERLDIESSNVKSIEEGSFNHLRSLKKLSLKHNLLEEIKNNIFWNLQIEELDLSDNRIKVIEKDAFHHMYQLRSINLKSNRIEVYETTWFRHLPALCHINLEHNLIKHLPGETEDGHTHTNCSVDLIFSHNRIEKIDERAFCSFLHLNRLYLDHNRIRTIEKQTFRFGEIEDLSLDYNLIVCTEPYMKNVKRYKVEDGNYWQRECLLAFKGIKRPMRLRV